MACDICILQLPNGGIAAHFTDAGQPLPAALVAEVCERMGMPPILVHREPADETLEAVLEALGLRGEGQVHGKKPSVQEIAIFFGYQTGWNVFLSLLRRYGLPAPLATLGLAAAMQKTPSLPRTVREALQRLQRLQPVDSETLGAMFLMALCAGWSDCCRAMSTRDY